MHVHRRAPLPPAHWDTQARKHPSPPYAFPSSHPASRSRRRAAKGPDCAMAGSLRCPAARRAPRGVVSSAARLWVSDEAARCRAGGPTGAGPGAGRLSGRSPGARWERSEGREKCASDACYCFTLDSYTPTLQSAVVKDGASR